VIYDVRHKTVISYQQAVSEAHHVVHLMPRDFERQQRIAFVLHVEPVPSQQSASRDYFGNGIHHLSIHTPHDKLIVESRSRVDSIGYTPGLDLDASPPWESIADELASGSPETLDAQQFGFESPQVSSLLEAREYADASFLPGTPVLRAAMELTTRIFNEFEYKGGVSDVSTPVARVLQMRSGVCQDFAHLQIACLRGLGLSARYVSGYLLTHPPAGQARMVGADASHAWLSVWAGSFGWVDFDPTNNLIPQNEHIVVGWGRDYSDVSPTSGFIVGGGEHEIEVSVDVSPVNWRSVTAESGATGSYAAE
jgi:transglutaminase-like putative cysteine protease